MPHPHAMTTGHHCPLNETYPPTRVTATVYATYLSRLYPPPPGAAFQVTARTKPPCTAAGSANTLQNAQKPPPAAFAVKAVHPHPPTLPQLLWAFIAEDEPDHWDDAALTQLDPTCHSHTPEHKAMDRLIKELES